MSVTPRVVVIGIGNRWRADDGVGLVAADRLRGRVSSDVEIFEQDGDAIALTDAAEGAEALLLVDSTSSGSEPGTITRFDASERGLQERPFRSSTHVIGLGDSLELARALGRLPPRVIVIGVEGDDFSVGEGLSPSVEQAVPRVVETIEAELGALHA